MTAPVLHEEPIDPRLSAWLARGRREVFTVHVDLDRPLASALIDTNKENRPVRWRGPQRSVAAYARAMAAGEWHLNGEAMIVSKDGQLNDGQHRIFGFLESGLPSLRVSITFGVERESRHTLDQGLARSPGNVLAMHGEVRTHALAAALRFLWCISNNVSFSYQPSPEQMLQTLDENPEIRDALRAASTFAQGEFKLSASYIAGAYYLCRRVNPLTADMLLERAKTGVGLSDGSPVIALRRRYADHTARRRRVALSAAEQAALFIKAFNMLLWGRRTSFLRWSHGPDLAEEFPRPGAEPGRGQKASDE